MMINQLDVSKWEEFESPRRRRRTSGTPSANVCVWARRFCIDDVTLRSMRATLVLALVASVTGVILRGPSVTSDTYIRNLWPQWNLNTETRAWWDGPLTINSATQIISAVNTDTSAILIKFDLRSFVGASLVPNKRAWLNYYVTDVGDNSSLRELVVPWNEVRARRPRRRAHSPHNRVRHPG